MANAYQHYCAMARALDLLGDRWTLLIVRDLLRGPQRFSDLRRVLSHVTPRQLTARLKAMEASNLVTRSAVPGRRQVTYALTERGRSLRPVVFSLTAWGAAHALGPPREGEAVHPEHLLHSAAVLLGQAGVSPEQPTRWAFRFPDRPPLALDWDQRRWRVSEAVDGASLVLSGKPADLAALLWDPDALGRVLGKTITVSGDAAQLQHLLAFSVQVRTMLS